MDRSYTIPDLSRKSGYKQEFIRSACYRAPWNHPLPHVKSGLKRPRLYIRESVFMQWLDEEEKGACVCQNRS